jgi:hypothetical protein
VPAKLWSKNRAFARPGHVASRGKDKEQKFLLLFSKRSLSLFFFEKKNQKTFATYSSFSGGFSAARLSGRSRRAR